MHLACDLTKRKVPKNKAFVSIKSARLCLTARMLSADPDEIAGAPECCSAGEVPGRDEYEGQKGTNWGTGSAWTGGETGIDR